MSKKKEAPDRFMEGFATAIAIIADFYGNEELALGTIENAGLSFKDFQNPAVFPRDFKIIKRLFGK